mmetsp:Transcript_88802/g.190654  ORF Transcript_88802/g.190654 Transcript_88802/m.190654 type:complete len:273 (-) Transcript_88802:297-1115(-)
MPAVDAAPGVGASIAQWSHGAPMSRASNCTPAALDGHRTQAPGARVVTAGKLGVVLMATWQWASPRSIFRTALDTHRTTVPGDGPTLLQAGPVPAPVWNVTRKAATLGARVQGKVALWRPCVQASAMAMAVVAWTSYRGSSGGATAGLGAGTRRAPAGTRFLGQLGLKARRVCGPSSAVLWVAVCSARPRIRVAPWLPSVRRSPARFPAPARFTAGPLTHLHHLRGLHGMGRRMGLSRTSHPTHFIVIWTRPLLPRTRRSGAGNTRRPCCRP